MRILIADDNYDLLDSLALLLESAGHEVYRAPDGRAARKLSKQALIVISRSPSISEF